MATAERRHRRACSYCAAMKEIGNADRQEVGRRLNNRAENSNQPYRRREWAMQRFRSMKHCKIQLNSCPGPALTRSDRVLKLSAAGVILAPPIDWLRQKSARQG